ncbi:Hsp20/alpha crystallin family protein [Paenibacillus flagellatus]|uniref:SHSP domain-containing protein n=1 Tax=Paenibacillus flagellatus TaxID=2211139 RepID=A0A2V5KUB4_9BACL|nr:Hsp20/alpha crystallin family protein [Paenibacillus flagellatus]PYI55457.1 hypothetical protein DLM86_06900 [Paenibacillus flagellatus]
MNDFRDRTFWKKLRSQADRTLGEQFWQDMSGLLPTQQPRTDVYATADRLYVVIELPGCRPEESVKLSVHKNALHVRGDIPCRYPIEEDDRIVAERFFGQFHRVIDLPSGISAEGMKARYRDGLLTVEFVRRTEPDNAVDIAIESEEPAAEARDAEPVRSEPSDPAGFYSE